jgi:uncharacterized protein (DUF849 family)
MDDLIINAALTGIVATKADNPNLPCTPAEIIADARRCRDAGASIVHIHARDESFAPTYKREIYREIIAGVREACPDLLICGSTSGRLFREFSERCQVLDLGPQCKCDLASLTLGSLNFPNQASVNEPQMIEALAAAMNARGIVPEWEIFELGMVDYVKYLVQKGMLVRPYYCNILLGSRGTLAATPTNLIAVVNALPEGTTWSAGGIGRSQFYVNCLAVTMGGHVRLGLEDNLYYDGDKSQLATNAGLVERIVKVARAIGREIASPQQAREIIGLRQPSRIRIETLPCAETGRAADLPLRHLHI